MLAGYGRIYVKKVEQANEPGTKDNPDSPMEGIQTWRTKKGWKVLRLHYTADPDKRSPEWKQAAMDSMPDQMSFNREFEIDFTSSSGLPFYPLFYEKYAEDKGYFCAPQPYPKRGLIYRGFDFGFRKPACIWLREGIDGVVRVLREFTPENIDVYQFRDAVKVLSGEMDISELDPERHERALTWLDRCHPEIPWFSRDNVFINFAGPEATYVQSIQGEKGELNDAEVFQGGGIQLSIVNQRVSAGTYIIRNIMRPKRDGNPGLQVDPSCITLIKGLAGGLTFGVGTKATPLDDEVAVHPEFSHIHDAFRYAICGFLNVADVSKEVNRGLDRPSMDYGDDDPRREPPRFGPESKDNESQFWATVG